MKRMTSSQVLSIGFAVILGLLLYSAMEAFLLQRAGGEEQSKAYRRFLEQDDAVTAARRSVWLGGISARDYFLDRTPAGREKYSSRLTELETAGLESLAALRKGVPNRVAELEVEAGFAAFVRELRQLEGASTEGLPLPSEFIEDVLIPRRLALLSLFEDLRATIRQDLVVAQTRYDADRAAAARKLLFLLGAALAFGILVALVSVRYAIRLDRERQRHYLAIELAKLELEHLSARVLEVQEQERRSLSKELHDEVGQTLTALRMEISQALLVVREPSVIERLQRARQLAESTVQIVRDISLMLRPSLLDDLGLGPALQWQLERFSSRSGIRYEFDGAEVGEELPEPVNTCVFRIAQEALNNCEKYAEASRVQVVLRHVEGRVGLEVRDDGCGFSLDDRGLPSRGTGILGMKERAQHLGGTLLIETQPGAGTRVALTIPLAAQTAGQRLTATEVH